MEMLYRPIERILSILRILSGHCEGGIWESNDDGGTEISGIAPIL